VLAQTDRPVTAAVPGEVHPIELITENGFSIIRAWEADATPLPTKARYEFVITDLDGSQQNIATTIAEDVWWQLPVHIWSRIPVSSSFWICCAERHLANYLDERRCYPARNELIVQQLDPEEIILARRWGSEESAVVNDTAGIADS
jgi:hypothetical protein